MQQVLQGLERRRLRRFHALITLVGASPAQSGDQDIADARKVSCVFNPDAKYELELREDEAGVRLRDIGEGAHIHAVLAWESSTRLVTTAFVQIPGNIDTFKEFFQTEMRLQKEAIAMGPSFVPAMDDTPGKLLAAAGGADCTAPPSWKRRKGVRD